MEVYKISYQMHIRNKIAKKSAGKSQRPDDIAFVAPVGQVDEPLSELAHPEGVCTDEFLSRKPITH